MEERTKAKTLRELLVELRRGWTLHKPILIEVEPGSRVTPDATIDRTMTLRKPLDWAEQYGREYAQHSFLILGPNTLAAGMEQPVTIGRSRRCDVRVENDSVSKVHGSVMFDRAAAEYYIVDENSRNGTCINGEALTPGVPAAVWSGAYVSFGDAVFVFIDPPTLRKLSKLAI
ncbi:MAG: FHA domain-containing protein [Proteobacteria bacterium]|nr:FHA domain-containing protein [Pseudomonadota bacterium]